MWVNMIRTNPKILAAYPIKKKKKNLNTTKRNLTWHCHINDGQISGVHDEKGLFPPKLSTRYINRIKLNTLLLLDNR